MCSRESNPANPSVPSLQTSVPLAGHRPEADGAAAAGGTTSPQQIPQQPNFADFSQFQAFAASEQPSSLPEVDIHCESGQVGCCVCVCVPSFPGGYILPCGFFSWIIEMRRVCLRIEVGDKLVLPRRYFCVSLQTEKSAEGAGPLRTVKSDGQADERTATVNSVSQIVMVKKKRNSFLCVCDSCLHKSLSKQMSRNCGSIFSWWLFLIFLFQFFTSDNNLLCRKINLTHQAYTGGVGQICTFHFSVCVWVGGVCMRVSP